MCGIAGLIDFTNESEVKIVEDMAGAVSHRGPDGQGVFFTQLTEAQIGLGHRRLSIIDLSHAGDQPMHFDGLHIIFNGEIYNFNEIREVLVQKGHQFITHSDTEVILHSWREWGEKAIEQWHGMFAIVLFDESKNEVFCIRDRAGVKPFYYYWRKNVFLFGSELKALMAHPAFERNLNKDAVASFLQYGYVAQPHSIFCDTFKLKAGCLLKIKLDKKEISTHRYWNVYDHYNKPKLKITTTEAIEETERILKKSFQYRMIADVPVGVFLSGGYDSTCVTGLLQKDSAERIKTFTIGMTEEKLNEAPFAKKIASYLGTDHTEYYCTPREALEIIPQLSKYYDEPFADSSAIPTMLVSRLARENVTVALSADAGDEVFAGYNRYDYISRYAQRIKALPIPVRKIAVAAMTNISSKSIPYFRNTANFHSRYGKLKNLLANPSPLELLKNITQVFNDIEIDRLFKISPNKLETAHDNLELIIGFDDPLAYMMAIDYQTYLTDDILQKVDRATMAVGLEGREPFLDQNIIEWAAQLPSDLKYFKGQKKYITKQIVHKFVPKEIMERPKMGFGIPIESWLFDELKGIVNDYLCEESLNAHGLFNLQEVNDIVMDFYNGRKENYLKVWYLLIFQMWYRQWMQGNS